MAVIRLECAMLEGWRPDAGWLDQLPDEVTDRSPLLQKLVGERLADAGKLAEAKTLLQKAVKAFARQTFQKELLSAFASLAAVYMRTGDHSDAETVLRFLKSEYGGGEAETDGCVLLALARGARLIGEEANRAHFYEGAFDWFNRAGDMENSGRSALEMILDLGPALGRRLIELQTMLRLRCGGDPIGAVYEQAYGAMLLFCEQRWPEACVAFAGIKRGDRLPVHLDMILRCYGQLASLRNGSAPDDRELERLQQDMRQHATDAAVQFHYARLEFERRLMDRDVEGAEQALRQSEVYDKLYASAYDDAIRTMKKALSDGAGKDAHQEARKRQWNVSCFGPIRFSNGTVEVKDISWKRKKAQELFLYLLLQPNYSCPRDQVVDALFAESDFDKQANQLYVTIHRLKQVLRDSLDCDQAIIVKEGIVKISGHFIEHADVEKYRSLVRVGDQLWVHERELAVELYEQAIQLYDEIVPDLPYVDWLDQLRAYYAEMQAGTLKKLVQFALDRADYDTAETRCTEWLRMRQAEEEAYQHMIRMLMRQGRTAEATRWYRKLEKVCREELNVKPLPETKQLLRGERP
jgi:DNA-binding SARP family transcriptional activator